MKKILIGILAGSVLIGGILNASTRRDYVAWTDRGIGNPSVAPATDISPTLEKFWNVQMEEAAPVRPAEPVISRQSVVVKEAVRPSMEASQTRDVREHHGHWGINLFNLIPVIDIVHGEVETESKDRVEGHR